MKTQHDSHSTITKSPVSQKTQVKAAKMTFKITSKRQAPMDETEYLMASPANKKRLDEAIKNTNAGKFEFHDLIEV